MQITDENKEFATIQRLREMLNNVPETVPYRVTFTHAVFTSILCWTVQRLRAEDARAQGAWKQLKAERIDAAPWLIPVDPDRRPQARRVGPFPAFQGFTVARLIICLRNAVAHGDERRISPYNHSLTLIGHEYTCVEVDRATRVETFRTPLILLREDMRRIGCALADRHCAAVNQAAGHDVSYEAQEIREAAG